MKTIIVILALTVAGITAQADDQYAAVRASCVKCHSATTTSFPRIDGQSEEYHFQTLKDYASKARHSKGAVSMMFNRVKALDDATFRALASYFAGLPATSAIAGDADLIAKGELLYNNVIPGTTFKTCAECHGAQGEGNGNNDPLNPRVAGQLKKFLKDQMENYKSGAIDNQAYMHDVAVALTDEQIAALVEFMASK